MSLPRSRIVVSVLAAVAALVAGVVTAPPASTAPRAEPVDYSSVIRTLRAEIPEELARTGAVGLTIALVDGDRIVWTDGFGYADRASGRPVTGDTLFHIGSVSKTFTAIAVMQLVQRGLVDLDRPLADYVPGFRLASRFPDRLITVRSVLDHHSGIPGDVFNGLITEGRPDRGFRDWLLRALRAMPAERPVNTLTAYSNSAYVLLQALVENVSGQSFDDYSREHLFAPMGMEHSTFDDASVRASTMTRNYQVTGESAEGTPVVRPRPREFVNGWTAGSVVSSATDMAQYLRTLLSSGSGPNGRVLAARTLQEMWTVQASPPGDVSPTHFGLGFAIGDARMDWAGRVVWHDGGTVYNFTMLRMLPGSSLGAFVSVNTATASVPSAEVADRALSLMVTAKTGLPQPGPEALPGGDAIDVDPQAMVDLAGVYAGYVSLIDVAPHPDGLSVTTSAGTPAVSTLLYRPGVDGWFRSGVAGGPLLRFVELHGAMRMDAWYPGEVAPMLVPAGLRVPANDLAVQWRDRLGDYREANARPHVDDSLLAHGAALAVYRDVVVLSLSNGERHALVPGRGNRAFTYGIGAPLGRGKGSMVAAEGTGASDSFTYLGVRYRRTPA